MKSKGKVDKTSNLNILKLNLEQIYTRPLQKPSNPTVSAKQSTSYVNKQVPEMRLDSDSSRNLHTSPSMYLAQTGRSIPDNESLLQFSSRMQDSFHSVQQYLKAFKGNAINQLNFDDLGAFVYDSKSPGLNTMLFDHDYTGTRKVTDTATTTISTMSQTMGSASRFLGKNNSDTHTQSFTARSPGTKPMLWANSPNIRKLVLTHRTDADTENSEAQMTERTERTEVEESMPSGRRTKTKLSNSTKLNEGKKTVDFRRRTKKSPTAPGVDEYKLERVFDKKKSIPVLRKKREFTLQRMDSENQELDMVKGEDSLAQRRYKDKEIEGEITPRRQLIQRSKTEIGGFRIKIKNEKKFGEEMKAERPGSSSQLLKAKRKERIQSVENGIENNKGFELVNETGSKIQGFKESHIKTESNSGVRFNVLKLDLSSLEENEEEEGKAEDAQIKIEDQSPNKAKDIMANINLWDVASEVLFKNDREEPNQDVSPRKLAMNTKPKEVKVEGNGADRKEKIKKTFKKTVRAVRIGRTFLNSITKKQSVSTPRSQLKARTFSTEAASPKKANEAPGEVVFTFSKKEKTSTPKIVVTKNPPKEESPSPDKRSKKTNTPNSKDGSGSGGAKLRRKSVQDPETIPMIRVIASENGVVLVEHSSRSNSRRASKVEDSNTLSAAISMLNEVGSPKIKKNVIDGDPKSWFDFSIKPVQKKLKKLRSMRSGTEFSTSKIFQDNQGDFVAAFNSTLRNTNRQLLNSSLIKIPEDNEQATKGVSRQISKKASNPLEELLKQGFDDDDNDMPPEKKGTLDSDIAFPGGKIAHQQSGPYSVKQTTIIGKEGESLKMYSRRDDVIIININPPIEEVSSKMEETVSPVNFSSTRSLVERLESSENVNADSHIPAVVRFTYDLHTRKHIEEDSSLLIEEFGRSNVLDQSFRNKTEELFKYDEIYKSTMDNFNTKSQRLRVRSNFFSFVERCIVIPTERWAHVELINNYMHHQKKEASSLTCIHVNQNNFEYSAKNFVLHTHPFIDPLIFLLTIEHLNSEFNVRRKRRETDPQFEDDDTEKERSRLKSSTLVFGSGEVLIPKSFLEDPADDYKRILMFKPLIVQINFQTILKMKQHFFNYSYYGTPGGHNSLDTLSIRYSLSMVLSTLNKENWLYLYRCIHKMYKGELYGFFEYKEELDSNENMVKEVDEETEIDETIPEIKPTKKRDLQVAGGLWRSYSNVGFMARTPRKTVTEVGGGNFTSHMMNLANAVEERKEEEEEDYKPEQNLGDNMKHHEKPRRHSKTSIKPLSHSNTHQNKPNTSAIEKSVTAFVEAAAKNKDLLSYILPKGTSHKMAKASHTDSTADQTGKLQIPRKNSNRQAASNSPRSHQEIKNETDRRTKRPPTITHTLTPSSDQSSPHRDDNAINLNNQSTLGAQFNRERTKTRLEVVSRSSTIRRDPSYGANSQTREKEETTQHILWALQPKPKEENHVKPVHAVVPRREQQSIKELEKSPIMRNIPDARHHTRTELVTEIGSKPKKAKKQKPQDSIEKFLFDAVYSKKFMEIKESLVFYPKEMVHIRDHEMNTLLIEAARMGHKEIVELLLNQGSDPNAQNKQGNTALHISLAYQHYKVADALIKHGAKQNILNNKGKTAWDEGGY